MMLEQQLRQLADDAPDVDPTTSVGQVIRRGRRRLIAFRAAAGLTTAVALAAGVVTVPALLDRSVPAPEVLNELPDEEVVAPVTEAEDPEPTAAPSDGSSGVDGLEERDVAALGGREHDASEKPSEPVPSEPVKVQEEGPVEEPVKGEPVQEEPEHGADGTFSAVQAQDHVEGDPPVAVYEGTGPVGGWVKVASPYGSAKTQIGASGEWRLEVVFHDAPYGTHTWAVEVWLLDAPYEERFELTATRPQPEATAFTASQARGTSAASPPTEVFWGTAQPGTKVVVESQYGTARTLVPDNGEWVLEVSFPEAPVGEPFPVEVHSVHAQESIWFEFERIG